MTMTRERFATGLTYDAYKAAMSRNGDRVEENERKVVLDPQATRYFGSLPKPLNVVVLAEDWSATSSRTFPCSDGLRRPRQS